MAHVLLIEPDTVLARTYMRALQHAGHHVSRADGAQAAIHAADEQIPDIVLLELRLAMHDGVEFLYEFRSYPEWQDIPVVINTFLEPSNLLATKQALEELGVTACLYKPQASLQQLLSTVRQQVGAA